MSRISFHVIRGLVKITHSWNVVFSVLPQVVTVIIDHNSRIPDCVAVNFVSFQYGRYYNNIMQFGQLKFFGLLHYTW